MVRGPKWVWVKLLLMVVLLENCWSEGCSEQERVALLQLKHFFSIRVEGDENNSDCCQWGRVVCNNNTGRVMRLHLSLARDLSLRREWYLNASLFSPFQELEWLDLSLNFIRENEGFFFFLIFMRLMNGTSHSWGEIVWFFFFFQVI